MDKTEFALLQAKAKSAAYMSLLEFTSNYMRLKIGLLSEPERSDSIQAVRDQLDAARKDYETLAFANLPPEMSDMYAGEFQEIFDTLAADLFKKVSGQ